MLRSTSKICRSETRWYLKNVVFGRKIRQHSKFNFTFRSKKTRNYLHELFMTENPVYQTLPVTYEYYNVVINNVSDPTSNIMKSDIYKLDIIVIAVVIVILNSEQSRSVSLRYNSGIFRVYDRIIITLFNLSSESSRNNY